MSNISAFRPRPMDRTQTVQLPMDPELECPELSRALRELFTGIPRTSSSRHPTGKVVATVAGAPLRFTVTSLIRTHQPAFRGVPSDILFDTLFHTRLRERRYGSCAGFHEYLVLKTALRSLGWMPTTWMAVEKGVLCFNYQQNEQDLLTLTVEFDEPRASLT